MKKLIVFLCVLGALAAAAVVMLPKLVSPERIKQELVARVQDATGRTLKIDGRLDYTLFPSIGVEVEKVSLSNPEGFGGDKPFVALEQMQVSVALMPLLNKDIQITRFVLTNPVIALHKNKGGAANWQFAPKKEAKEAAAKVAEGKKSEGGLPANLRLSDIEIKNGALSFMDEAAGSRQSLEKVNAKLNVSSLASPLDFVGSAVWQGKDVSAKLRVSAVQALLDGKPTDFDADVDSELLQANAKGKLTGDAMAGHATIKSSSLKQLSAWLQPGGKPMGVPTPLAFELGTDANCKAKQCDFANLAVVLDHIKATGTAKLDMNGAKPVAELALTTNELDLRPFTQSAKAAGVGGLLVSEAYAQAEPWSRASIDFSGLKAADVTASLNAPGIMAGNVKIGQTPVKAVLKGGRLDVNVTDAKLYGGAGTLALSADAGGAVGLKANLQDVQLEPLLTDAMQLDRLSGRGNMQFDVAGRGGSQAQIVNSLGGNGKLSVRDGQFKRVNLMQMVNNINAAFASSNTTQESTPFSQLDASFAMNGGVLSNNDLMMVMPGMRVAGAGNIDLGAYTINYRLTPQTYSEKQQDGKTVARQGVNVPVLVTGSLDNPRFAPDAQAIVKDVLSDPKKFKDELKNSRKELKEQLVKDPKEAIKNIKGLLR